MDAAEANETTPRCPRCQRPDAQCVCSQLAPIPVATRVTLLQHPGERKHAFNTARLTRRVVAGAELQVAWPRADGRMACEVDLAPDAVLLYPSPDAADVEGWSGPPPSQLVVLDGTWSQVRRLLADNPWLKGLPAVKLSPAEGSRYRIREEPAPHCLSTIESVAYTLRAFEPDNRGLDRMLDGFDAMVDGHLAARPAPSVRFKRRTRPSARDRLRDWERVVVVYAEALGLRGERRQLLQWAAVRPSTGEVFDAVVLPTPPVNACQLGETELSLEGAGSVEALQAAWAAFVGLEEHLFAWTGSTGRVARSAGLPGTVRGLKELYGVGRGGVSGTLDVVVRDEGLAVSPLAVGGRASERLANAVAVAAFLRDR